MKTGIPFSIAVLMLAAGQPAYSEDRTAFDEAFPRPDWRSYSRQDAQAYTGIGETIVGAGGGVATLASGNLASMDSLVKEEGNKAIRAELNRTKPELALQLLSRDTAALKVDNLVSRKNNLLSEMRNGHYVDDSGYQLQFRDGKSQSVYVSAHHYESLTAVEKEQSRRFIAEIESELPAAQKEMAAMKEAAAPAEKVYGEMMGSLLKNRAAGTLTAAEAEIVSAAKRRLGLGLAGTALSVVAVVDGITRFMAAADDRNPGWFPSAHFGQVLSSRAIRKISGSEAGTGGFARGGYDEEGSAAR